MPASVRISQLKTNLARLRAFGALGNRFVVCNIPAAQIEAVENDTVVSRYTAVVGKPDRPSPEIQSKIVEINFNPYWTVPVSIVRRDLIPKMQAEPDYLAKNRIHIFDPHGRELPAQQINWYSERAMSYRFKQDPGDFNSLGSIRINFPNSHEVYMHDTPFKNLFGEDFRFHSSGCVRVQNVRELVNWLLATTPVATGNRSGDPYRGAQGCPARTGDSVALGLRHRLGDRGRGRAVPRGHLQPRRPRSLRHARRCCSAPRRRPLSADDCRSNGPGPGPAGPPPNARCRRRGVPPSQSLAVRGQCDIARVRLRQRRSRDGISSNRASAGSEMTERARVKSS